MSVKVLQDLDLGTVAKITGLAAPVSANDAVRLADLNSAVEGLAWKDSCRVATQSNLNLSSPGATIDGITMSAGDRVLVRAQTAQAENGIYLWNGAAVAMSRALDCDTAAELEQAVVTVEEGTSAGATYRQTSVNFTLGSGSVAWTTFGTAAGSASETSAGIAELATQAETDAGTDDARIVTPLKLKTWSNAKRLYAAAIGDGAATQYTVTHNLGTRDAHVAVYRNSAPYDTVLVDVERDTTNSVVVRFAAAPASNAYRVVVLG
jgi:hypothetical protein